MKEWKWFKLTFCWSMYYYLPAYWVKTALRVTVDSAWSTIAPEIKLQLKNDEDQREIYHLLKKKRKSPSDAVLCAIPTMPRRSSRMIWAFWCQCWNLLRTFHANSRPFARRCKDNVDKWCSKHICYDRTVNSYAFSSGMLWHHKGWKYHKKCLTVGCKDPFQWCGFSQKWQKRNCKEQSKK